MTIHPLRTVGALVAAVAIILALWPATRPTTVVGDITASDERGRPLPPEPVLRPGARLTLTVGGFAPGAPVDRWVAHSTQPLRSTSDERGRVYVPFMVPLDAAERHYLLVFSGASASAAVANPVVARPGAVASAGAMITASVPTVARFPYAVAHPASVPDQASPGTGGRPLARTGLNVIGLVVLGLVLVASGVAVERRTRRAGQP